MEGGGEENAPSPPSPPRSPDSPPRDPPIAEIGGDHDPDPETEIGLNGEGGLSDELRDRIVRQVEYYFSDENLPTDKFLLKYVKKNGRGFVPIGVIASFRKMKKLAKDHSLIEAALRTSSNLVVSEDGKKVRRLNPLPVTAEVKDDKLRMVVVENLQENYSEESIRQTFGEVGKIVKISNQDPQSAEASHGKKEGYHIRTKVHAIVEYDSVEAAEKAVATLNDEKDWRSGLRVKRLSKQTVTHKFDNFITKNKESEGGKVVSEKDDKEEEHAKGKKHNYRNRKKGHAQESANEQGHHGCGTAVSNSGFTNKPLPGPRMPDGTRGFTMGRGKPVHSDSKPNFQDP